MIFNIIISAKPTFADPLGTCLFKSACKTTPDPEDSCKTGPELTATRTPENPFRIQQELSKMTGSGWLILLRSWIWVVDFARIPAKPMEILQN